MEREILSGARIRYRIAKEVGSCRSSGVQNERRPSALRMVIHPLKYQTRASRQWQLTATVPLSSSISAATGISLICSPRLTRCRPPGKIFVKAGVYPILARLNCEEQRGDPRRGNGHHRFGGRRRLNGNMPALEAFMELLELHDYQSRILPGEMPPLRSSPADVRRSPLELCPAFRITGRSEHPVSMRRG